jgi:hypothetical protein
MAPGTRQGKGSWISAEAGAARPDQGCGGSGWAAGVVRCEKVVVACRLCAVQWFAAALVGG